jgi:hypothetical protein
MSHENIRKLPVPATEVQPKSAEAVPFDLIPETKEVVPETRKKTKGVLEAAADYLQISTPNILDGDQAEPVNSYHLKDGEKIMACSKGPKASINSNVVMIDPKNDSFAVIQGVGEFGEKRLAAKYYAKAFEEYKSPFRGQLEAEKEISRQGIRAGASYMYGKIIKEKDGKKYFQVRGLGDDVLCAVYDKNGADKTNPDYNDRIVLQKGDRVLLMSRQMGITPDDVFDFMIRPGSYSLKPVRDVVEGIRKATEDKPVDQAFVLMEIK